MLGLLQDAILFPSSRRVGQSRNTSGKPFQYRSKRFKKKKKKLELFTTSLDNIHGLQQAMLQVICQQEQQFEVMLTAHSSEEIGGHFGLTDWIYFIGIITGIMEVIKQYGGRKTNGAPLVRPSLKRTHQRPFHNKTELNKSENSKWKYPEKKFHNPM